MGLRYDTFRVRDMHKYVITYTVAHQQYTNKCAHMQRKDKFGNNWGKRTTSNDRVSKEAADFLRLLAQARNRSVVPALRKAAVQASIARWSAMLTLAAQAPFAASLTSSHLQNPASHTTPDGDMPPLSTLLEHHPGAPPPASRLPLRPWGGPRGSGFIATPPQQIIQICRETTRTKTVPVLRCLQKKVCGKKNRWGWLPHPL